MLSLSEVHCGYGNIEIIKGISLTVEKGQIVAIIGANGAGKTTTLKTIAGLLPVRSGSITFDGNDITKVKPPRCGEDGDFPDPGRQAGFF